MHLDVGHADKLLLVAIQWSHAVLLAGECDQAVQQWQMIMAAGSVAMHWSRAMLPLASNSASLCSYALLLLAGNAVACTAHLHLGPAGDVDKDDGDCWEHSLQEAC